MSISDTTQDTAKHASESLTTAKAMEAEKTEHAMRTSEEVLDVREIIICALVMLNLSMCAETQNNRRITRQREYQKIYSTCHGAEVLIEE